MKPHEDAHLSPVLVTWMVVEEVFQNRVSVLNIYKVYTDDNLVKQLSHASQHFVIAHLWMEEASACEGDHGKTN